MSDVLYFLFARIQYRLWTAWPQMALRPFETPVNIYQATQRITPENLNFHMFQTSLPDVPVLPWFSDVSMCVMAALFMSPGTGRNGELFPERIPKAQHRLRKIPRLQGPNSQTNVRAVSHLTIDRSSLWLWRKALVSTMLRGGFHSPTSHSCAERSPRVLHSRYVKYNLLLSHRYSI